MYLHEYLDGAAMVGAVKGRSFKTPKLQRFGYVTLTAKEDNLFCPAGGSIRAHEFHYYDSDNNGASFRAEKPSGKRGWDCVIANKNLYAGYPHLYLPATPGFAESFARRASEYAPL